MLTFLRDWFLLSGIEAEAARWTAVASAVALVALLAWIADLVARRVVVRALRRLAARTSTQADDLIVANRVFLRLSHLAPAIVVYLAAPQVLVDYETWIEIVRQVCLIYMVLVGVSVLDSLLNAVVDIVYALGVARELPLRSVVQVLKLALYCVGFILLLSLIIGRSPLLLFSGLGAMTAVLMLIFKDPILGFVAGIQLAANHMVAPGDWIEMPQYGADGDVIEVGLTTVKIQNFDKTITTVPTYALISGSFKNWRGMAESGGRRIKRAIRIDMRTIRFCDAEMLERFAQIEHLGPYIEAKRAEIAAWNEAHGVSEASPINGRRLTNIGTFRAYIVEYLRHHPLIHQDLTMIVRQLPPTEHGLPIEVYAFTTQQSWVEYEGVMADIFDHLLAALPAFDLRVVQLPTGADLEGVAATLGRAGA